MARKLATLFLVLTIGLSTVCVAQPKLPRVADSIKPLQIAVTLKSGETLLVNICTVTSIGDGVWLTAAHCVSDVDEQELRQYDYRIMGVPVTDLQVAYREDLALLKAVAFAPPLALAAKAPEFNGKCSLSDFKIVGYPLGVQEIDFSYGCMKNLAVFMYDAWFTTYQIPVAPGSSGSAVLNSKDEIVGVVQICPGGCLGYAPVSGAAPYSVLKAFLTGGVKTESFNRQ